jgi:arylsulfatase A-like enzyme
MLSRRTLLSAAPAFAQPRKPNILLLFPDQWRFDWGPWNPQVPIRMPNLAALMRRGVTFTQACVASPLCAPSRACLASGQDYPACGVRDNGFNFPPQEFTYYRALRENGYRTLAVGKLDLHKATQDWGLDGKRLRAEWGFSDMIDNEGKHDAIKSSRQSPKGPYMAYLHAQGLAATHVEDFSHRHNIENYSYTEPTPLPDRAYCDNWLAANGLRLLAETPANQPWHLAVNFTGPHDPMDVTRAMAAGDPGRRFPAPIASTVLDAATHQKIRLRYTQMCENIDRWVGEYVEAIRKRGEIDNTLIVFSSDHGEMLSDVDLWGKSKPHDPSIRVPLIAAGPDVPGGSLAGGSLAGGSLAGGSLAGGSPAGGKISNALVAVHDLAATFLDYAGAARPRNMEARSLRPILKGKAKAHRQTRRSALHRWSTISDGRWKLVSHWQDEPVRLYDTQADPHEQSNLADKHREQIHRLRQLTSF